MLNSKTGWLYRAHNLGLHYRSIIIIIFLSLSATVTEIFGIGIFLPIFQFIRLEGNLEALATDSTIWQYILNGFAFVNIDPSLIILLLVSFSFFLGRQVITYFRLVYNIAVRQRIIQIQRNRIFNGYIDADTLYHDNVPVGNLVNIITTEVNGAVSGVMAPMELIVYVVMLFGYLIILSLLSWKMTLVSVIVLLLSSAVSNIWIRKSAVTGRKLVNANTIMSEFLVGRLRSPRLVRLSGTGVAEKNEFHQLTQIQRKYSVLGSMLQAKTEVVMEPIVIGLSLVFLYLSYTVFQLQIETIGLYLLVAFRLLPVVKGIIAQWQTVQRLLGSMEIVEDRFQTMQDSIEKDFGTESLDKLKKSVMINNASYRYPTGQVDALKNITINFKVGEMTAIVGPSGGGKSTLIDLLPCLRLPTKGLIQIDGLNIEKYTLTSLRKMISYAPQFPQIFDGTVKSHILYGKIDATNEEVIEAAQLAGIEDFINQLPQGFETILGEDAVKLSGGQRQRLDLARVLVSKSPLIILDEPTSNLDAHSEKLFASVLDKIRNSTDRTIIIVSHNLSSILNADQIVVLNYGLIESTGKHEELLKNSEWYSSAWKLQNSF